MCEIWNIMRSDLYWHTLPFSLESHNISHTSAIRFPLLPLHCSPGAMWKPNQAYHTSHYWNSSSQLSFIKSFIGITLERSFSHKNIQDTVVAMEKAHVVIHIVCTSNMWDYLYSFKCFTEIGVTSNFKG